MASDSKGMAIPDISKRISLIHEVISGVSQGLTQFASPSRAALLLAIRSEDPLSVYDPQGLLVDHRESIRSIYVHDQNWRVTDRCSSPDLPNHLSFAILGSPRLPGLIAVSIHSYNVYFQAWFTEYHPNSCSTGPAKMFLREAAGILVQELGHTDTKRPLLSTHYNDFLRGYANDALGSYRVTASFLTVGFTVPYNDNYMVPCMLTE